MKEVKRYKVSYDYPSRYKDCEIIVYDSGESVQETPDRIIIRRTNQDKLYTVESGFANRLDLISWKVYGSSAYWWVIAAASNITDVFNIPVGTVLTVPPLTNVRGI